MGSMQKVVSETFLVINEDTRTVRGEFSSKESAEDWADNLNLAEEDTYIVEKQD